MDIWMDYGNEIEVINDIEMPVLEQSRSIGINEEQKVEKMQIDTYT
jgi:hypothetical protein